MLKKATLKSFNATSYKATVQLAGSLSTWLADIPVSRGINKTEMVAGRSVAILLFDQSSPADAVVLAVFT